MFATIFTTGVGVVLMACASAAFCQSSGQEIDSQTTLAVVHFVRKTDAKAADHNITGAGPPKPVYTLQKHSSVPLKRKTAYRVRRIKIAGYRGQTFVYGEVIVLKNGKLEGFIYHPDNSKTYVYGEKVKESMFLYDASGNLYQMLPQ